MAHLVNQQVVHEIMALEILTLLLENPTDDSVEVAVGFIKEIGLKDCAIEINLPHIEFYNDFQSAIDLMHVLRKI